MMTTAAMNREELTNNELELVNGSTINRNTFNEERYHEAGIRTEYHWFSKDEFWLPDGTKTNMNGADEYVKKTFGEKTFEKWRHEHAISERFSDEA